MMPIRIAVLHVSPDEIRPLLIERCPEVEFIWLDDLVTAPRRMRDTRPSVLFTVKQSRFQGPAHRECASFETVEWVHVGGSGFDHLLPFAREETVVTNCAGVLARYLAETVTGAMLALNGNFLTYLEQKQAHDWKQWAFRPLSDQTLLIVGLGAVGRAVATNAKALGMRVVAVTRRPRDHAAVELVVDGSRLDEMLSEADIVSLHVPATADTAGLFDAQRIARMKRGAMLINTARGAVVDAEALTEALRAQHLRAAYLDVFDEEPLPPSSPLWDLKNLLITPHVADNIEGWPRLFAERFADNLERWRAGKPLLSQIRPPR
jgi:D-2-hydroxyacid dehydrogenase (NADP+)